MAEIAHAKKRVLVVDDSMVVREQVGRLLGPAGFEVMGAEDGVDALQKLERSAVSLIVCDVNMPRMDGLEFLAALHSSGNPVPVVMLTTEGQHSKIQQAKAHGAKGWIVKPFKPEMLVAAVRKLIA